MSSLKERHNVFFLALIIAVSILSISVIINSQEHVLLGQAVKEDNTIHIFQSGEIQKLSQPIILEASSPPTTPLIIPELTKPLILEDSQAKPKNKSKPKFASNEFLIKISDAQEKKLKESPSPGDTGVLAIDNLNKKHGVSKFERVIKKKSKSKADAQIVKWQKVKIDRISSKVIDDDAPESAEIKRIIEEYRKKGEVVAVEPNYIVSIYAIPNDPYYSSSGSFGNTYPDLYGMHKINAANAWDYATGSDTIIVADIDTGVDRNHEDIAANMWTNPGETPNNGIDDDANGFIDDYYGWDWYNKDNDPMDDHGHGTHTVGTIAGVGNNALGVVGVNWKVKIMALKFLSSGGSGYLSDGIAALQYAADMGARVSSNSWGCACNSQAMDDAVKYEHDRGMIMVAAAGNSNLDALSFSPASADYAITVAASDFNDAKASFSNWGEKIDVAAPGVNILSAKAAGGAMCTSSNTVGVKYCYVSGTSMAAPHVAGLAALILSRNPSLTNEEVRQIIRNGADDLGASGKDANYGYGRINAAGSFALAGINSLAPIIISPMSRNNVTGSLFQITGRITGSNFGSYKLELGLGKAPTSWTVAVNSTTQVMNGTLAAIDSAQYSDGKYIIRLTAFDTSSKAYQFQVHDVEFDNFDVVITSPTSVVSYGLIDIFGTAQTKSGLPFSNYKIEWGIGINPTSWTTSGITLTNGGNTPVIGGKLADWDTTSLTDGLTYTLRLTVVSGSGSMSQATYIITVDNFDAILTFPFSAIPLGTVDILGTAITKGSVPFQDYFIEWSSASSQNSWSTSGITLTNGGLQPITNGKLGTWDTTGLIHAQNYNLRLSVRSTLGINQSVTSWNNQADKDLVSGWPKVMPDLTCYWCADHIADLDGDGTKEAIFSSPNGKIQVFRKDGSIFPGFPVMPDPFINWSEIALNIDDMDGDGKKEIITVASSGRVFIVKSDGTMYPGWSWNNSVVVLTSFGHPPLIIDLDGDGTKDIVGISSYLDYNVNKITFTMRALRLDGTSLPGFPKIIIYTYTPPVYLNALAGMTSAVDLDRDGKFEIAYPLYNFLFLFDHLGNILPGWPFYTPPYSSNNSRGMWFGSAAAAGDIDGDGRLELFAGASGVGCLVCNTHIYALHKDGTQLPGWPKTDADGIYIPWYNVATPSITDIDNDNKDEVITGFYNLAVFDEGGKKPLSGPPPGSTQPALVDVDGDGQIEMITSWYNTVTVAKQNGASFSKYLQKIAGSWFLGPLAVADMDNNGKMEVMAYSRSQAPPYISTIYLWEIPTNNSAKYEWPMFGKDSARTSRLILNELPPPDTTPPTSTITSPANNSIVSGTINIAVNASDSSGIAKVELYIDSSLYSIATIVSYTFVLDTNNLADGAHLLQAKAYDTANNVGMSPQIFVTASNPPNVTAYHYPLDLTTDIPVTITANSSEASEIRIYVDSTLQNTCLSATSCSSASLYSSGLHTYYATAQDLAGNMAASEIINFSVASVFDFSLSDSGSKIVAQGSSIANDISPALISGATQPVSFSVSGLPSGATASFLPLACDPTCSTTLTISTAPTTATGTYNISITGAGGSVVKTTSFTLTVTSSGPRDWYVAAGATGTGTSLNPFGRIQDGLNAAMPGDTIIVRPGIYSEILSTMRDGTSNAGLRLISESGLGSVTATAAGNVFTISHAFHTIDGIIFDGQYGANDLIRIGSGANNLTIINTEIKNSGRDCIDMAGAQGVLVENSLIHNCIWWDSVANAQVDAHGIAAGPVKDLTIRNTEIHTFTGDGVQVDPGRTSPGWDRVLIEGSRFWNAPLAGAENGMPAGKVPGENAVDTKSGATFPRAAITIRDVTAHGFINGAITNQAAFNLKENVNVIVDRATVYDSEIGFRIRGPGSNGGADVTIQNVVVYNVTYGIRYEDNIVNPKVWSTTFGSNIPNPFFAASSSGTVFDVRNFLLLGTGLPPEVTGSYNLAVGAEAFDNAANNDYHLAPGSNAKDAGTLISAVIYDRDGISRPQGSAYDIGAYELVSVLDPTPPTVSITYPLSGETVSGTINISSSAFDNVYITKVELYRDNILFGTDTTTPYVFTWDTTSSPDGAYALQSKAHDSGGNTALSSIVTVNVANLNATPPTPPTVTASHSPLSGITTTTLVIITANSSTDSEIKIYVDSALLNTCLSATSCSSASLYSSGLHTYYATAQDLAGNIGASEMSNFTVELGDIIAPNTYITSPVDGAFVSGLAAISASASDNTAVSKVEFYADTSLIAEDFTSPYSAVWDTRGLGSLTSHALYTKAYDAAGNVGTSPSVTVKIADTTKPIVSITSPLNNSIVARNTNINILASATDDIGIANVKFYVNNNLRCNDTSYPYECSWRTGGTRNKKYNLRADAFDASNNKGTSEIVVKSQNILGKYWDKLIKKE